MAGSAGGKDVGTLLRDARQKRGLTLRAVAAQVGISVSFLSDVERGLRSTSHYAKLAEVLGISVVDILAAQKTIPPDLAQWITQNPKLLAYLRDCKERGVDPFPMEKP